jgi:hypothetical protein
VARTQLEGSRAQFEGSNGNDRIGGLNGRPAELGSDF